MANKLTRVRAASRLAALETKVMILEAHADMVNRTIIDQSARIRKLEGRS